MQVQPSIGAQALPPLLLGKRTTVGLSVATRWCFHMDITRHEGVKLRGSFGLSKPHMKDYKSGHQRFSQK